jgi:GxxExxY protein
VYEECLALLLRRRGFKVECQKAVAAQYMGVQLDNACRIDLLVEDCVVVELKAVSQLDPVHTAQLNTYLRFSGCKVGLLMNFNVTRLVDGLRRVVRDHDDDSRISPSSAPSARNVVPESAGRSQP